MKTVAGRGKGVKSCFSWKMRQQAPHFCGGERLRVTTSLFVKWPLSPPVANLVSFKVTKTLLAPAVTDAAQHCVSQFHHPALIPEMQNNLAALDNRRRIP